ncbi:MAG: glycosyltransferase family 2 protein [Ferruginibacter sp.]
MTAPLVSLITVNFNTPDVTAALLQSLHVLDYPNWEIIVVDNASPQFSSAPLKKDFPFITHVSCPQNLGFAGGNNVGIHFAKGEYIFLINNDTEVTPGLITGLVNYLQTHPQCGMVCPKIKYHFLPDTIQYAGAVGLHPLTSRSYDIGYMEKDEGQRNDCRVTDLPNGAAVMLPATVIEKAGLMSELFFLYYEELDWAARVKKAGYEIHYAGIAEIFHKESVSTGKNSPFKTFYLYRNRLLYIRRNYKGWRWLIAAAFFVAISSPVHIIKHALKREWKHSQSIWNALIWNIRNDPFVEPANHSSTLIKTIKPD